MMRQSVISNGKLTGIKYLVLLMAFLSFANTAKAGTDPVVTSVFVGNLNQIKVDSIRETYDPVFYSANKVYIQDTTKDVYRNVITLLIDENDRTFITDSVRVSITIQLTWWAKNGSMYTKDTTLTVNYDTTPGSKYRARDYIYFDNARKVRVKILSINQYTATWDVTTILKLENRMEIRRDYIFDCATTAIGTGDEIKVYEEGKLDELWVYWEQQFFKGITHYEVEWNWIPEEALHRYKKANPANGNALEFYANYIFRNNSSRATITADHVDFAIPMFYEDTGYLFYRVRPLQYREDGQIVEGKWTITDFDDPSYFYYAKGHEPDLNWQASTSWAEDGKRNSTISYFDGTLRSRQSVTKDNSTGTTVIAETWYDFQGRPAINILPAPTLKEVVAYAQNFNRFVNNVDDPKDLYDLVPLGQTICSMNTPLLDSNHGTSNYYSGLNSQADEGIHKFIPHADGFPYSETRYTPDATGRLAAQGGVGPVHQLNSGHETKYYYGMADQRELNALFGTEVGYASHYFKNMVRDANGQYSVSYLDMHGRTIATALAGAPPANLKKLDSYPTSAPYMKKNLLNNNVVKGRSIQSSSSLLVPMQGNHEFEYSLSPESAEIIACNPNGQTVCYDCYYDLEIRITGTCNEAPIIIRRKNFSFGEYDTSCTAAPVLTVDTTIFLTEGEYNITKTLTLSQDAQDWYRDSVYIKKNLCKSLQEFYNEIYELIVTNTDCEITCTECEDSLGTYNEFRTRFLTEMNINPLDTVSFESEIVASYNEAKANCEYLCGDTESELYAIRMQMLQDMTPGEGQYAKLDVDLDGDGEIEAGVYLNPMGDDDPRTRVWEINTTRPYNIFNTAVPYPGYRSYPPNNKGDFYRNPINESDNTYVYKDEFNQPDPVSAQVAAMTPEEFSNAFGSNWAQSLLYYHPEYCKLKVAETPAMRESYRFDAKLQATDTWQQAMTLGYNDIVSEDPFFTIIGSTYESLIREQVETDYQNTGKSMWQIAIAVVKCRNSNDPNCINTIPATPDVEEVCEGDWNYAWKIFRTLYMSEKDRYVNMYLDAQCPGIRYDDLARYNYTRRFGAGTQLDAGFASLFGQMQALLEDPQNAETGATGIAGDELDEQRELICASQIASWKEILLRCPDIANHGSKDIILQRITDQMKEICKRGYDENHPFGASSVPPGDDFQPKTFEAVITSVLGFYTIDINADCHPWMIQNPPPYEQQTPIGSGSVLEPMDSCVCKRLDDLAFEKETVRYPGTLSQFIQYQHGVFVRQSLLDSLNAGCDGLINCSMYEPAIKIPAILDCETPLNNCIECGDYATLKAEFKIKFPTYTIINSNPGETLTDTQLAQNVTFESFMNYRTGFSKTWVDYLFFDSTCKVYNQDTLNCKKLDSLVAVFLSGPHGNSGGDSCRIYFTSFINAALGTSYTFAQIQSLFMQKCGHLPDICAAVLNCKGFTEVIAAFYLEYGSTIRDSTDCQALFTDYFNDYFDTDYTWNQISDLYQKLCGGELDVCKTISCKELENVLNAWLGCKHNAWMSDSCMVNWVTYFNTTMGTSLQEWQIADLYKRCNLPYRPCDPPVDAAAFTNLVISYNNLDSTYCAGQTCHDCFKNFINETLGRKYSYEQIALIYKRATGKDLAMCETRWKPEELTAFSNAFIQGNMSVTGNCDSLFTAAFNTQFSTSLELNEIMAVYELYTGEEPEVCATEPALTCSQLTDVLKKFQSIYPNAYWYFGDSLCKVAFTAFVNQSLHTNLVWADVVRYYESLCGLTVDVTVLGGNYDFESFYVKFLQKYEDYHLPKALLRDLFTNHYNASLKPRHPLTWPQIVQIHHNLGFASFEETIFFSANDTLKCEKVPGVIIAFRDLSGGIMPKGCEGTWTGFFNQYFGTSFTGYGQLDAWFKDNCDTTYNLCGSVLETSVVLRQAMATMPVPTAPRLCNSMPMFPDWEEEEIDPCDYLQVMAWNAASEQYQVYMQNELDNFDSIYKATCLDAGKLETFTVRSQVAEYHYTLYYYNQAGNLVKTIPPAGVKPNFTDEFYDDVQEARDNGVAVVPEHWFETNYRFNSLDQKVQHATPDAGLSKLWYDALGRLVVSQNAKQSTTKYSYTKYDLLGRIVEVGQLTNSTAMTQAISQNQVDLLDWYDDAASSREQITKTFYDEPQVALCGTSIGVCQQHLRNRVSYSTLTDLAAEDYASATYFSYDIHGNVDTLLQHYNKGVMQSYGGAFKKMFYNYDVITGKMNDFSYQRGVADQFFQRYHYDAQNRLKCASTSLDGIYWEQQSIYSYYKHGPTARTKLGQLGVQGVDYIYTLQGWIKGTNSTAIGTGYDPGLDGESGTNFARDAYGYGLNYYIGDYRSINSTVNIPFVAIPDGLPQVGADGVLTGKNLYNGNIRAMVTHVPKLGGPALYGYQYDQRQQMTAMNAYTGISNSDNMLSATASTNYKERVSYDANGNILGYFRNGTTANGNQLGMDSLSYKYLYITDGDDIEEYDPREGIPSNAKLLTNKLIRVRDSVPMGNYTIDIDDQVSNNYQYDAIGNLVADADPAADISNIEWNVYGKISKIEKTGKTIYYTYDATGNRISKRVHEGDLGITTTWYVRDGSGNVISVYENNNGSINIGKLSQVELNIYGSTRIGLIRPNRDVQSGGWWQVSNIPMGGTSNGGTIVPYLRGITSFELTNHLGNVLATISDKKIGVDDEPDGEIDYYLADVITANDYYPFGMGMPERKYIANSYRYGFNGKENDNEVKGQGNQQDFGMRIYDTRVVKFLSTDPLANKYPSISPFASMNNNPLRFTDPTGAENDDVILRGGERDAGFQELQNSVAGMLTLAMDADGRITYTRDVTPAGLLVPLTDDAKKLVDAIDNHQIDVVINNENTIMLPEGTGFYFGGAYMGNTYEKKNVTLKSNTKYGPAQQFTFTLENVTTRQDVNPLFTASFDRTSRAVGVTSWSYLHEVTESFIAAKAALRLKMSQPPADPESMDPIYRHAHKTAASQGPVPEMVVFDPAGNPRVPDAAGNYFPGGLIPVGATIQIRNTVTRTPIVIITQTAAGFVHRF